MNKKELRRSKRKLALTAYCLQSLSPYRKFIGSQIKQAKSKYPQSTCTSGHRKVRTYCVCSPGILRCVQCFTMHCLEIEHEGERSD